MKIRYLFIRHLPPEKLKIFKNVLRKTRQDSRFDEMTNFIQHGDTTVKEHCITVAYTAYFLVVKFGLKVDERSLIRGALLHDYFLYDWHEKSMANMIHGFTHPHKAFLQAKKDFELSHIESDMIKHHMFPLTPMPPKTKEGIILCIADKICATKETVMGRFPWRT